MPSTYFLKLSKPVWIIPTIVSNLSLIASQRTAHQLRRYSVNVHQRSWKLAFMVVSASLIASRTVSNLALIVSQRLRHFSARAPVSVDQSVASVPFIMVNDPRMSVTAVLRIVFIFVHIKSHIRRSDFPNADQSPRNRLAKIANHAPKMRNELLNNSLIAPQKMPSKSLTACPCCCQTWRITLSTVITTVRITLKATLKIFFRIVNSAVTTIFTLSPCCAHQR